MSVESLPVERWSVPERLRLIERLWDSLPESVESTDIPAWHVATLESRRADLDANPDAGRPWREVLDDLEAGR